MLEYLLPEDTLWQLDGTPVSVLTPDTGLYGYYARQILSGHYYPLDQADRMPSYLIAFSTWLFSANMDWVIFLLPLLVAPLVVIPTILIGNLLGRPMFGFVAALFLVTDLNYFGRTYISCLDTDMLNLFFPMMVIYYMIKLDRTNRLETALGGAVFLWLFSLWYHSFAPIAFGLLLGYLFTIFLFYRNSIIHYQAFFIFFVAIMPLHPFLSIFLVFFVSACFKILNNKVTLHVKYYWLFFIVMSLLLFVFIDLSHYYARALVYFDRPEMEILHGKTGIYYFYNQLSAVAEAV
jgi:asparagine N-glycosylation enzyme membrane subunit Stt3